MQRKVILERDLSDSQCCFLRENGIYIFDLSEKYFIEETLAYGSYRAAICINGSYVGRSTEITLWGPCHLKQTNDMNLVIEFWRWEVDI